MSDSAMPWDTAALWSQLDPLLPGLSVEVVARSVSTNTDILERIRLLRPDPPAGDTASVRRSMESAAFGRRASDVQPCLLVAEQQTGGRGRQGRHWHAAAGSSLTFSLALPLRLSDWSGLSLAVGVALAEALDPASPGQTPRIGLKWPNDLWLMDPEAGRARMGRKLGGILIETVSVGAHRIAVVGVGLNVHPLQLSDARQGVASLSELGVTSTPATVLHQVALPLVNTLRLFERKGFPAFAEAYHARDLLHGRGVHTTQADAPQGVAVGVSAQGALRVQTPTGVVHVSSGEVSVRLGEPDGAAGGPPPGARAGSASSC